MDDLGNVVTSTNPTGRAGAWTAANVDGSTSITGVSCPAATLCVAVDEQDSVVTSTNPTGGAEAWTATEIEGGNLHGVSCASATFCVAVDDFGEVVNSTNPTGGTAVWTAEEIGSYDLLGVSCASATLCVAVDGVGAAFIGTPNPSRTLTVDFPGSGTGTVTSSPTGIDCDFTCSHSYAVGTMVTLTATPDAGSTFTGWSGGGCSGTGACELTLDSDKNTTATFTTVGGNGGGGVLDRAVVGSGPGPPVGTTPAAFGARTLVTLKLAAKRIPAKGPLKVRVSNANDFLVTGKLSSQTVKRVSVTRKRRIKLKAKSFHVAAHSRKTVKLRLPKVLRRLLKHQGKLKLRLTAKVKDPAGNTRTVKKRVTPRLKKKHRR